MLVASPHLPTARPAVVVVLAGYDQTRGDLDRQARLTRRLAPAGVLVAVVQGVGATPGWGLQSGTSLDVGFVSAVIARLVNGCGDPSRVIVVGFSDGGLMAARVGCALGARLRALVMVSSSIGPSAGCRLPHTVLAVHGTKDPDDPYDGDGRDIPPARPAIAAWARLAGCTASQQQGTAVEVRSYRPCAVSLVTLAGAGHTWPSGAAPSNPAVGTVSHGYDLTAALIGLTR